MSNGKTGIIVFEKGAQIMTIDPDESIRRIIRQIKIDELMVDMLNFERDPDDPYLDTFMPGTNFSWN